MLLHPGISTRSVSPTHCYMARPRQRRHLRCCRHRLRLLYLRVEAPAARAVPAAPPPEPRPHHISLTGAPGDQGPDDTLLDDAPPHTDDHTAGATSQGEAAPPLRESRPAWSSFDAVDLTAEFGTPVPTMQSVPVFLRSGLRQAFVLALRALREEYTRGTAPQQTRAWKLFLLAPRFLLHRAREPGTVGREAPLQHSRDFLAGRWDSLLGAARAAAGTCRHRRCR